MHSMPQTNLIVLLIAFLCGSATVNTRAEDPEPQRREGLCFPVLDLQGSIYELGQNDRNLIRVFVFLSTECPISNSYIQTLNRLWRSVTPDGVELFGVVSDATVKRAEAATHFKEFKATMPILFDVSAQLADVLKPSHGPEAFVLNTAGVVV